MSRTPELSVDLDTMTLSRDGLVIACLPFGMQVHASLIKAIDFAARRERRMLDADDVAGLARVVRQ